MSLFFYLFTFAINLCHRKFVTADVTAVTFVNNQHGIQRRGQDFDKKFTFEGVHSKQADRRIFWEKLDKGTVLIGCWKSCGTQAQLTDCSGRLRSARTEENVETVNNIVLSQEDNQQTHRTVREISRETGIHRCTQNAVCLHILPILLNVCKIWIFNFPK